MWRAPQVSQYNQGFNWQQFQRPPQPLNVLPDREVIWRSDWIPMNRLENQGQQPIPDRQIWSNAPAAGNSALAIARQYYPQLFRDTNVGAEYGGYPIQEVGSGYQPQPQPQLVNNYGGYRQPPQRYQRPIQEVTANCDRRFCYFNCRLMLLGGGRCTKGGCMCYVTALDYMGVPQGNRYAEDNIWYELTELERRLILDTMRTGVPRNPPPQRPPAGGNGGGNGIGGGSNNSPWGGVTSKPNYGSEERTTAADWLGGNDFQPETTRPPYVTSRPDIGGGGWWGGEAETTKKPATARPPFVAPPVTSRPPFSAFDDDDYGSSGDDDIFSSGDDDDEWGEDDDWMRRK